MKKILPAAALAGALVAIWALGSTVTAQETAANTNTNLKLPLKLRAWAVNMSNVATGTNTIVDFTVSQWSTEMERSAFITTFLEKGPNDLLKALQKAPAKGRMRYPNITGPDQRNMRLGW